jgi:hypothetical protein
MKQEWTGLMVCKADWEPRHPQDFARGVKDEIAPEGPSRPGASDVFDEDSINDEAVSIEGTFGGTIT